MKNLVKIVFILSIWLINNQLLAQCDYTQGTINVSTSGFESSTGYFQNYAVVEDATDLIVAINSTGNFTGLMSGNYRIYAINYEGVKPDVLSVDSLWANVVLYDANSANCFATLGPKDAVVTVCESVCFPDSSIIISTSGYELSYSQIFVLVNKNDSIYASNTIGIFSQTEYIDSGVFQVYALNTNDINVENEIADGGLWADVVTMELSTCTEYIGPRTFDVSSKYCPMPMNLNLITLNGENRNQNNYLYWNVNPNLMSNLVLEKSIDGIHFDKLKNIESNVENFIDNNPFENDYYRIRYLSNGNLVFSNIVNLKNKFIDEIGVYPVPADERINIKFNANSKSNTIVEIHDALDRKVYFTEFEIVEGLNLKSIETKSFTNGFYFIIISNQSNKVVKKFIVKH